MGFVFDKKNKFPATRSLAAGTRRSCARDVCCVKIRWCRGVNECKFFVLQDKTCRGVVDPIYLPALFVDLEPELSLAGFPSQALLCAPSHEQKVTHLWCEGGF